MMISNNLNSLVAIIFLCRSSTLTQDEWFQAFSEQMPEVISRNMLELRNREFGITKVKTWVEQHGSMQGRFQFLETYAANSEFYQKANLHMSVTC